MAGRHELGNWRYSRLSLQEKRAEALRSIPEVFLFFEELDPWGHQGGVDPLLNTKNVGRDQEPSSAPCCLFPALLQSVGSVYSLGMDPRCLWAPSGLLDRGLGVRCWARAALSETSPTIEHFEFFNSFFLEALAPRTLRWAKVPLWPF